MAQPVSSWSFSKLQDFERCKYAFKLKHVDRIPEPERPLPPGKTEHANDRGTRIHTSCEEYINGTIDELDPDADKHFGPQIDLLRVMHADGLVSLEGEWGMDDEWCPAEWKSAWLRLKLDAMVMHDDKTATVIDFKTGRKFGNEIKHGEQLQLYQLVTFLRYPKLEKVYAELWYLDQPKDNVTSIQFTRPKGLLFKSNFDRRGHKITMCTSFPANPNIHSCKYCSYGQAGICPSYVPPPDKKK